MISVRPSMHARDSSGRQVSLLNDEPSPRRDIPYGAFPTRHDEGRGYSRSNSYVSESSSPRTPGLWRSDSYGSRTSNDPHSPLTPSLAEYGRQGSYAAAYPDPSPYEKRLDRSPVYSSYSQTPAYVGRAAVSDEGERVPSAYDDERRGSSGSERPGSNVGKRYPCRFKLLNGCDKSFTTSGHASRHAKIHSAEKGVHCTFGDCPKKFTRADNMKQHLEIHYKDRSRSAANHRNSISSTSKLTVAAGVRKPSSGARISRPSSRAGWTEPLTVDTTLSFAEYPADLYTGMSNYSAQSPSTSPRSNYGALDMGGFQHSLPTTALSTSRPDSSSGLDTLAAAVASQMSQ